MIVTKRVDVYSRKQACLLIPDSSTCLISLSNPDTDYHDCPNYEGWRAVLRQEFYDLDNSWAGYEIFGDEHASELLAFVCQYQDANFVVHCDAGVSRSVAVGTFMRDFLDFEKHQHSYKLEDDLNRLVYKTLGRHFRTYFKSEKR